MKLPKYKLKINPDSGEVVNAVAMVESPAIESNFLAFSNEKEKLCFSDDKMELLGAALIPNKEIYRRRKDGFEYLVEFETNEVRFIAQTFFEKGFHHNINLDHTATNAKSYIFQSFIVDSKMGIQSPKGIDAPDGSWIIGVKVNDDEIWNDIKLGKQKGFSIEGIFEYFDSHVNRVDDNIELEILELINNISLLLYNKK